MLDRSSPYRVQVETFERGLLERALAAAHQNVSVTASRLGVTRKYLYDRFEALGIGPKRPTAPARKRRAAPSPADPESEGEHAHE